MALGQFVEPIHLADCWDMDFFHVLTDPLVSVGRALAFSRLKSVLGKDVNAGFPNNLEQELDIVRVCLARSKNLGRGQDRLVLHGHPRCDPERRREVQRFSGCPRLGAPLRSSRLRRTRIALSRQPQSRNLERVLKHLINGLSGHSTILAKSTERGVWAERRRPALWSGRSAVIGRILRQLD